MRPIFAIEHHQIYECDGCQHRMTRPPDSAKHVEETYGDDYFQDGRAGYPGYLEEEPLLRARGARYANLAESYLGSPGRVLDVGAAAGFSLKSFVESGWQGVGIEPNRRMALYAREELGLDVRQGTIEKFSEEADFDLICLLQVISHLVDLQLAIRNMKNCLAAHGLVLIETWNWQSWTARGLGARWHQYSPPSVLHWFCPQSLDLLMDQHQLERVATGRPRKRLSWRHARSLLSYKLGRGRAGRAFEGFSRLVPDKADLPYPLDDARWFLYKQKPSVPS
ncbi:MAG: class I SAM-dependent methyltransferase [bacterium]|nr:class I SAM-dependent methyltransferase [bacterium]